MHIYPIDLSDFSRKYVITAAQDFETTEIVDKFLKTAKLDPSRYAGTLFTNILESFLIEAENIELTYKRYYSREYDTVEEYMYKKMLMDKGEIEYVFNKVEEGEQIYFSDLHYTSDDRCDNKNII